MAKMATIWTSNDQACMELNKFENNIGFLLEERFDVIYQ